MLYDSNTYVCVNNLFFDFSIRCFINYQTELEKLKAHFGHQLSLQYESKNKGTEKIVAENERLRKELKKVRCL